MVSQRLQAGGVLGAAGSLGGAIAIGAGSAAVGSIVSQGLGVATGIQDKFSWKAVGLTAFSGGFSAGLGGTFGSGIGSAIARGVLTSAVTQGIGVATGLQDSFSWAGVAAAGVGAGFGRGVGGAVGNSFGGRLVSNTAGAIANAATRSAIEGSNFGRNIAAAIPDAVGQALGNALAGELVGKGSAAHSAHEASHAAASTTQAAIQQPAAQVEAVPTESPVPPTGQIVVTAARGRSRGSSDFIVSPVMTAGTPNDQDAVAPSSLPGYRTSQASKDLGARDPVSTPEYLLWAGQLQGEDRVNIYREAANSLFGFQDENGDWYFLDDNKQLDIGISKGNEAFVRFPADVNQASLIIGLLRDIQVAIPEVMVGAGAAATIYSERRNGANEVSAGEAAKIVFAGLFAPAVIAAAPATLAAGGGSAAVVISADYAQAAGRGLINGQFEFQSTIGGGAINLASEASGYNARFYKVDGQRTYDLLNVAYGGFSLARAGVARFRSSAAERGVSNIATAPKLAEQLRLQSARSPFTASGKLTPQVISDSRLIIPNSKIGNPNVPSTYNKYSTPTFQSPTGDFQTHFYMNPKTGDVRYDLDYKIKFNGR